MSLLMGLRNAGESKNVMIMIEVPSNEKADVTLSVVSNAVICAGVNSNSLMMKEGTSSDSRS